MDVTYTVRAAPLALRRFLQLRLKAHQVVRSRTGITQNYLSTLLTHLAVVLMVSLIAITILITQH